MTTPATPNMGLVYPTDTSQMPDVKTYLNDNWDRIESLSVIPQISTLPAYDTVRQPGALVYLTDTQFGLYILLGTDSNWGSVWRPLSAPYSPWVAPANFSGNANAIIQDTTKYRIRTGSPFKYRISNRGRVEFTGAIEVISGFWPSVGATGNFYPTDVFKTIPTFLRPGSASRQSQVHLNVTPYPCNSSSSLTEPHYANCYFYEGPEQTFTVRARLDVSNVTTAIFFSGSEYYLGDQGLP